MVVLTRREFLEFCAAGGAGLAAALAGCAKESASPAAAPAAATPSVLPSSPVSVVDKAAPAPSEAPSPSTAASPSVSREVLAGPVDGGKSFSGTPASNGDGGFDPTSRKLEAHVFAIHNGPVSGSGAMQRSFLRWTYTLPSSAPPTKAAVVVTFNSWSADAELKPDPEGGATAWALLHVDVSDAGGNVATTLVKRQGWASLGMYSLDGQYLDFDSGSFVFQPGVTYNLDVTLSARADVGTCDMYMGYGLEQHQQSASGTASVTAMVSGLNVSLVNLEPPWIQTHITTIFNPTLDTYDLYERDLKALTGKDYFASGALFRVSAGGSYDQAQSGIRVSVPNARILKLTTSMPVEISDDGEQAILTLPPASSLPLGGASWPMGIAIDPQYTTFMDRLDPAMPVFGAPLLMMADVEAATRSLNGIGTTADARLTANAAPALDQARTAAARMAPQPAPTSQEVFTFRNICLAVPLSEFQQLTLASGENMARASGYQSMPVSILAPSGVTMPKWDTTGLSVSAASPRDFPGLSTRISTEPWVITGFLALWEQLWACFYACRHPLAEWQGLEYPAKWNPRFVTLLQRVGESAEYWRTWFNGLLYMPPWGGEAVKLADLPESAREAFENGLPGPSAYGRYRGSHGGPSPLYSPAAASLGTAVAHRRSHGRPLGPSASQTGPKHDCQRLGGPSGGR